MKILLIKPEIVGIFSFTNLMDHEPLELEYLYTVLSDTDHEAVIFDRRYEKTSLRKKLQEEKPDVAAITGSVTQEKLMKELAQKIKEYDKNIKVIVGGTHVELNYENFYDSNIDYICHTSDLKPFTKIIEYIYDKSFCLSEINGIAYREDDKWIFNSKTVADPDDLPVPNRSYFEKHKQRFRYLGYYPLALIKTAYSCPYDCSFCYCTNINSGVYRRRNIHKVVEEIKSIDAPYIHIVDDDFLVDESRLRDFISLIKKESINKKYLIYGRADFIAKNKDIMKELKDIGLTLVMVGLEAVNDKELDLYNKRTRKSDNESAVKILNELGIECAALFIVNHNARKQDFNNIYKWAKKVNLMNVTVSIFTPMKGCKDYLKYKDQIINNDVIKQDLFHCIIKPLHMSLFFFYFEYYKLMIKLFNNARLKSNVYKSVKLNFVLDLINILAWKIIRKIRL